MTCPNCGSAEISPLTNRCELCGFAPGGSVAVEAPHPVSVDELARQELADQFHFDASLGHGTKTAVYLAHEQGSTRAIVVKVLPRPAERRTESDERFRSAVEAVAALEHPHIVPVFDHGSTEHLYWYSMEHVQGGSLRTTLHARGPLELKACQRIIAQVASALDYAHRRGIVHGALKPENVLIDAEGWVHVCDLLVSLSLERSKPPGRPAAPSPEAAEAPTAAQPPKAARPPYVAPETLRTPFSDQYALGVLVYECLTGAPPAEAEDLGAALAASLATARPDVPSHLAHAIRRAVSEKEIDRFPSVLDFVAVLETYTPSAADAQPSGRGSGVVLVQTDWKPPPRPFNRRRMAGIAVAIVVVAALVLLLRPAALQLWRRAVNQTAAAPVVSQATDSAAGGASRAETGPTVAPAPPTRLRAAPSLRNPAQAARPRPEPSNAAAPRAAPAPAADSGRLFVSATPWGQLYVDGQLVGNTPKANLSLAAGAHTIRIARDGFEPFERSIQIEPGQVVRLTDIVLAARRP
ncbi:MAG: serine/threonine-protein kinase [Gemmatimonadales bacterium]